MKLVHVTTVPDSLLFLRGQVGYMQGLGYAVSVVTSPGEQLDAFAEQEHVTAYAVPMPRRVTPLADLRTVLRLWRIFRDVRPDIVHAHTPKGGLLGMISATLAGVPVRVYHMRGLPLMTAKGPKRALLVATERVSCALASRVICVSHSLREVAIAEALCSPDAIVVMLAGSGNGVDSDGRFNPARLPGGTRASVRAKLGVPDDAVVVGFVGRLVKDKGVVELASAWRGLRERHPALHLVLVGPWEDQDPVPGSVRSALESDERVHIVGFTRETAALYAAMDIVTLPTYREGFPNVPLEAAAMGLPVVATRIPGCVDAVADQLTGTLVPPADAGALEAALERYVTDPTLRAAHGRAGRARVESEFRRERIWEAIAQTYAALLAENGTPASTAVPARMAS